MIDDMALLKQEMELMDAEDPVVAQAAKDRAAQTLGNAKLSFSKIADLIEQRRLLLRPRILTNIKRMDQPGMLGDAAFRDAGSALRREGQSFRQIAEAIELNTLPAPRYEDVAQESGPPRQMAIEPPRQMVGEPLYQMTDEQLDQMPREPLDQMAREPRASGWLRALLFVARIVFFPLRHPFRFLAIALAAMLLYYTVRGSVSLGQQVLGYFDVIATVRHSADNAMSSVSSFVNEQILRRSKEAPAPPPTPASIPSPASPSSTASAPPATAPAPSGAVTAPSAPPSVNLAPPSAFPASPPVLPPRREPRGAPPSRSTANRDAAREDRYPSSRRYAPFEDNRSGALEDIIPPAIRRRSLTAGPCVGGIGGCYWGGFHY
jgi:hypothetical protein